MSIKLNRQQYETFVDILAGLPQWQTPQGRLDLLNSAFAFSARKNDALNVPLDGAPREAAGRVAQHLARFGVHDSGDEALVTLAESLRPYFGTGSRENAAIDAIVRLGQPAPEQAPAAQPASPPGPPPTAQAVREALGKHFRIDEIKDLWGVLHENYENVPHTELQAFARETVSYFDRRSRLPELVAAIRKARGNVI